jgi:hypothetical protein
VAFLLRLISHAAQEIPILYRIVVFICAAGSGSGPLVGERKRTNPDMDIKRRSPVLPGFFAIGSS